MSEMIDNGRMQLETERTQIHREAFHVPRSAVSVFRIVTAHLNQQSGVSDFFAISVTRSDRRGERKVIVERRSEIQQKDLGLCGDLLDKTLAVYEERVGEGEISFRKIRREVRHTVQKTLEDKFPKAAQETSDEERDPKWNPRTDWSATADPLDPSL